MDKRIYRYDFNETLKKTPNISPKEREYVNRVFKKDLDGGLTPWELKQRINKLSFDKKDELDQWELRDIKRKLLEKMGE